MVRSSVELNRKRELQLPAPAASLSDLLVLIAAIIAPSLMRQVIVTDDALTTIQFDDSIARFDSTMGEPPIEQIIAMHDVR